jgi:putative hydrolase of the HAD superfamily
MHCYRSLSAIHAMTFDLDDTLYDNWPVIRSLEEKVHQWLQQEHPVSRLMTMQDWLELKLKLAQQDPSLKEDVSLWREVQLTSGFKLLGYSEKNAQQVTKEAMSLVSIYRNQIDIPEITHSVLRQLSKNIPLIAITNGNVDAEKIGLSGYFEQVYRAGPDGRAKPYADLFQRAQQHLSVPAHHILHVGDHLNTDVFGARANGFQACWFNDKQRQISDERVKVLPDIEIICLSELLPLVSIEC